jgi:hypothetical protein
MVCSDSMSSLQALQNKLLDHPLVYVILDKYYHLSRMFDIVFCWTPGHVGIAGNEQADKVAKNALTQDITPATIPYTDIKPLIDVYIKSQWQGMWDENIDNKLHHIQPVIKDRLPVCLSPRRDQVVLTRCQIGHSRLTHLHLLFNEPAPVCVPCQCPLTVKHLLLECIDFAHIRGLCFQVGSLQDLFTKVDSSQVINFLKRIGLYFKI